MAIGIQPDVLKSNGMVWGLNFMHAARTAEWDSCGRDDYGFQTRFILMPRRNFSMHETYNQDGQLFAAQLRNEV